MGLGLSEYLTTQFYAWEERGRGWNTFDSPVELEPQFVPFFGHQPPKNMEQIDSGRRPRFFPRLQEALGLYKEPAFTSTEAALEELEELYPVRGYAYNIPEELRELQVNFGKEVKVVYDNIEQLILLLSTSGSIVSFELLGTADKTILRFVCNSQYAHILKTHIMAFLPDVFVAESYNTLAKIFEEEPPVCVTELGLRDEFVRPLRIWNKFDPDPLSGCIATMENLNEGETAILQVLFQPVVNAWSESIYRAVTDEAGRSFFVDSPEMLPLAKEKTASPLFAVVVRTIGIGLTDHCAENISTKLAQSLISFHREGSNTLIPLSVSKQFDAEDIINRSSHRTGMILNVGELASIAHIPDKSVISSKLRGYIGKTKKAPKEVIGEKYKLGLNSHLGENIRASLSDTHRLRHMHLIGSTGVGKSSLLLNLIAQDIEKGLGVTVLDPHGDLIDTIISHVPDERLKDVVLVDPSDIDYPIGLNLLSTASEREKIVLSSDLVSMFRRFSTSWGDQMTSVLANAINAILESKEGGTLLDLRRFLIEASFRKKFLENIEDPSIVYYWKHEFQLLRTNSIAPILTRLDTFLRPKTVRNMMASKTGLDFADIINSGKILLVKLAQGLIGDDNSYILGTLFVAKLHQAAQARQNLPPEQRKLHYFYIDEFQNFITPSMSAILSGARKYGLGLILAHQDLDQLARKDPELANSVLSNPYIRICFRTGDKDAATLSNGFSFFDATDLQNLKIGQAIARVGQKENDFNLSFDLLPKIDEARAMTKREAIISHTRATYAIPKEEAERILNEALDSKFEDAPPAKKASEAPKEKPQVKETPPSPKAPEPKPVEDEEKETVREPTARDAETQNYIDREIAREKQREHRKIQEYIKGVAQERNFKATIEEPVTNGKVDVGLLHDDLRIACEVSVTNSAEYEVQNIKKCLEAGYSFVFMISNDRLHLEAIRNLAIAEIDSSYHSQLLFMPQENFSDNLDLLLSHAPLPPETETRVKGYRVKVKYTDTTDQKSRHDILKSILLGALRRDEDRE